MKHSKKFNPKTKNIILLVGFAILQAVFFFVMSKHGPLHGFDALEISLVLFSGTFLLFFFMANFYRFKTGKGKLLFSILCILGVVAFFAEGKYIYRSRNNYAVVLQVESVEKHEEYWTKNRDYTSLGGEERTLRPLKEGYYVDNNTPYRLRLYEVHFHQGKLKSSETVGYIEPYKLVGLNQAPQVKFHKPTSNYRTSFNKNGDIEEHALNEIYLCVEFCTEAVDF